MVRRILVVLFVTAVAVGAYAAEQQFAIDAKTSKVTIELPATGHDVEGAFKVTSGQIRFDPAGGAASGEITIDAKSGLTGNGSRDKKMHAAVLESEKFPTVVFKVSKIDGPIAPTGASKITIHGTLVLHGTEHPLSAPAGVEINGTHIAGQTTFAVPFVSWGLRDPSIIFLHVDPEVKVTVNLEGTLSAPVVSQ